MTFPQDIQSATPARYRFSLVTSSRTVICNPEPLEWANGSYEIKRDLEVGGVFSTYQSDSLTFVGNGAELLKQLFESYGLNAECTLVIEWWKSSTRTYVEFPSRFNINFNFYEIVKVGKTAIGVRVKAVNSSFQTKLTNREGIDINLTGLTTLGGATIKDYKYFANVLQYSAVNVYNYGKLLKARNADGVGYFIFGHNDFDSYTAIPLDVVEKSGITELQSVQYSATNKFISSCGSFLKNALFDYTLTINYTFEIVTTGHVFENETMSVQIIQANDFGIAVGEPVTLLSYSLDFGESNVFQGSVEISVSKGNDLKLVAFETRVQSFEIKFSQIEIKQSIAQSPEVATDGFPVYEALERTCQHIFDTQYPFYSDFFGRTGIVYAENGSAYSAENQLRFAHIQSGLNQRGITLSNTEYPFALSFNNLFKSVKALWNVGYGFETVEGTDRLRIEPYAYFFNNQEIVFDPPLKDRIGKYDIVSQVMPELVPVSVKSGFDNYEYLSINGRAEPNTTNSRTSIMQTSTKMEIISPFRTDTKGILTNLSNQVTAENGTQDLKTDNAMFVVKTQKLGDIWVPEHDTNITIVDDSSIFGTELLNRYFTPTRMLVRHGNRITAGMTLYPTSKLTFQTSDKSSSLRTTGEGYTVTESDDITISDLASPIFKPMKHTIECRFDLSDLEVLQANPTGYIWVSDTISGYILSLKKKNGEDRAEITIIEKP